MVNAFHVDTLQGKDILCFGCGNTASDMLNNWDVCFLKINFIGFTDNNDEVVKKKFISWKHGEIPIYDVEKFKEIASKDKGILIVVSSIYFDEIINQLRFSGVANTIICMQEFDSLIKWEMSTKVLLPLEEKYPELQGITLSYSKRHWISVGYFDIQLTRLFLESVYENKPFYILLSPPKTGNHTIMKIFKDSQLFIMNTHTLARLSDAAIAILKYHAENIIIGFREPVSQRISLLFSMVHKQLIPVKEHCKIGGGMQWLFDDIFVYGNGECYMEFAQLNQDAKNRGYEKGYRNLLVDEFPTGQILEALDINLLDYDFDKARGWSILSKKRSDTFTQNIFVYKLEKFDNITDGLKIFCEQLREVNINKEYSADASFYEDIYTNFKNQFVVPEKLVEEWYQSDYMKHFYSDEEIEAYKSKWRKNMR